MKELRQKLDDIGLNQCEAARALGIDPRTMRRYCAGHQTIPRTVWLALEALHHVKASKSRVVSEAIQDAVL